MSCSSDDVFVYDVVPPRQYVGAAAFQKPWQGFLDMFKGDQMGAGLALNPERPENSAPLGDGGGRIRVQGQNAR
jgi:hypothetical protein